MGRKLLALMFCLSSSFVQAHPGGLDYRGGHHDRRSGTYHLHTSSVATSAPPITIPTAPLPRITPRTTFRQEPRTEPRRQDYRSELATVFTPVKTPDGNFSSGSNQVERLAETKLATAKQFIQSGAMDIAKMWLTECVTEYPQTAAATEARELLKNLGGEPEKLEKHAESKLRIARQFLERGEVDIAIRWLRDCV